MPLRIALGLGITVVMFAIAGRRFFWLYRLISAGEPAVPSRFKDVPKRVKAELVEVGGQKKLLQWTVPGTAHAFTFWGFTILILTIIEAYGALFQRDFHIPLIGTWSWIGFLEDFFAVAVLVSLNAFTPAAALPSQYTRLSAPGSPDRRAGPGARPPVRSFSRSRVRRKSPGLGLENTA